MLNFITFNFGKELMIENRKENLEYLKKVSKYYEVYDLTKIVLKDLRFKESTGSGRKGLHHYGTGGLLQHTKEVCEIALTINDLRNQFVNPKAIVCASIFHDAGKMWDYAPIPDIYGWSTFETEWESTEHKDKIYHINRSALLWSKTCCEEHVLHDDVLHAILAHHQLREWGSNVKPKTKLAWLIHLADSMSARLDDLGGDH